MAETATNETAKKPKRKMRDAYVARGAISIPLDMDNPESYRDAVEAIKKLKDALPPGAVVDLKGAMGKLPEEALT